MTLLTLSGFSTKASALLRRLRQALQVRSAGERGQGVSSPGGAPRLHAEGVAEQHFQLVFEHAAVGLALTDRDARILHANAALEQFLGRPRSDLRGRSLASHAFGDDAGATREKLAEFARSPETSTKLEARFVRADGSIRWGALMVSKTGVGGAELVAMVQDTSERKLLESQLVHQAFHDALTRLPNRALFRERVERALERAARGATGVTVLLLDLDNFKDVNDTQGHAAGDQLLQAVAERLLNATRGSDTVARLGGDEFAILLENVEERGGLEAVLDRIVGVLRRPVQLEPERAVTPCASLGVAVYSGIEDPDELLRNADLAMYEAKLMARGRFALFKPSMHAAALDRVALEGDLTQALARCELRARPHLRDTARYPAFVSSSAPPQARGAERSEFHLVYQPIVHLASGKVVALEALARWEHPTRGAVSPEWFIHVAEKNGSISTLGRWVLGEAARTASAWNCADGAARVAVSVNVSGKQLAHDGIVADVASVLGETGLPPELLLLEITETAIMQDAEHTLARLLELKRLGVRLAIDDFGTGYSSLAYLQRFPVDVLKIDRIFADGLREGAQDHAALIGTILSLSRTLELTTVFEGVEEVQQFDRLRALGCDAAQGYFFGIPITASDVPALLARASAGGTLLR